MPAFEKDGLGTGPLPRRRHASRFCADHRDTVVHSAARATADDGGRADATRWRDRRLPEHQTAGRRRVAARGNLFGFRDGTSNRTPPPLLLDAKADGPARSVKPARANPAGPTGGTYRGGPHDPHARRVLGPKVGMFEQTNMVGRDRVTGALLGGFARVRRSSLRPRSARQPDPPERPHPPRLVPHPENRKPAHPAPPLQLRPAATDQAGNLDQGLLFVAFNQDIARQFETVQKRLEEEEMADYITPVGGGYYFVPRAAADSGDWVGSGMFAQRASRRRPTPSSPRRSTSRWVTARTRPSRCSLRRCPPPACRGAAGRRGRRR